MENSTPLREVTITTFGSKNITTLVGIQRLFLTLLCFCKFSTSSAAGKSMTK
jgi:hypothetical protein